MRFWLVEATDRRGALWGFLFRADRVSAAQVRDRMKSLGRVIEISGQTVEVSALDLFSIVVRHDATEKRHRGVRRYSLEGDKID